MRNHHYLLCSAAAVALAGPSFAADDVAGDLILFNDNGAWSWFQDPRVIVDKNAGKILVGSTADSQGTGGGARDGDVDVVEYDLATKTSSRFVLGATDRADDHNVPSFYIRSDGRYLAAWSAHDKDNLTRYRISTNPGDATSWGATTTRDNGAKTTYENLHYLPGDDGGNGRLYNFSRINFDPTIQISSDEGLTWGAGTNKLLTQGTSRDRPYLRYASNGDEIHFIATEEHPRDFNNSIYHGYVKDGKLFASDGTQVDGNLFDNTAVDTSALTTVFAASTINQGAPMTRAWTVDLELDKAGNPYAVFQARVDPGTLSDGGTAWTTGSSTPATTGRTGMSTCWQRAAGTSTRTARTAGKTTTRAWSR